MIKQWKYVIIAGITVLMLGVALLLVIKFVPQINKNPEPPIVPAAEGVNILSLNYGGGEVKQIDFSNKDGDFMRVLFDKYNAPYIEGADLPVDASGLDTLVFNATQLYGVKKIGDNLEDLDQYGLKDPSATFKITKKDGTILQYDIGDETPIDEGYYYGLDHSTNTVYTFSHSFERLKSVTFRKYVEIELSPLVGQNEMSRVNLFRVKSPATGNEVVEIRRKTEEELKTSALQNSEFTFVTPKGAAEPSDGYLSMNVLPCFEQVKAEEAVVLHPTAAQLKQFGVDKSNAYYDLYFEVDGKGYQFYYSKPDINNNMYVWTPAYDVIYAITTYNTTVLRSTIADMQNGLVFIEYLDNIGSITISKGTTSNGEFKEKDSYTFDISGSTGTEATEKLKVTYKGKEMSADEFGKMYQIMLGVTVAGQTTDTPAEKTDTIVVTYKYRGTGKEVKIIYRSIDGRRYQIEHNGVTKFYTLKKQIDTLLTNLDKFVKGETVESLYS